jgi:hypothetical protein
MVKYAHGIRVRAERSGHDELQAKTREFNSFRADTHAKYVELLKERRVSNRE